MLHDILFLLLNLALSVTAYLDCHYKFKKGGEVSQAPAVRSLSAEPDATGSQGDNGKPCPCKKPQTLTFVWKLIECQQSSVVSSAILSLTPSQRIHKIPVLSFVLNTYTTDAAVIASRGSVLRVRTVEKRKRLRSKTCGYISYAAELSMNFCQQSVACCKK